MKKIILLTFLLIIVTGSAMVLAADKNYYSKYLTVADVEKVTGMKGIVAKHSYSLHFYNSNKTEILIVRFHKSDTFESITKDDCWTPYSGVGDEAKIAFPGMPSTIAFTKEDNMVEVLSLIDPNTFNTYLSVDQLDAVCKIIEERITGKKAL